MELKSWMKECRTSVLDAANSALARAHLTHYEAAGSATVLARLAKLYDLTGTCLEERNLTPIVKYAATIAHERFGAGYDISEVQTAINVLEEAMWKRAITDFAPSEYAVVLGSLGTVLGAAKDSLARGYVEASTRAKSPSLDLSTLFRGV